VVFNHDPHHPPAKKVDVPLRRTAQCPCMQLYMEGPGCQDHVVRLNR